MVVVMFDSAPEPDPQEGTNPRESEVIFQAVWALKGADLAVLGHSLTVVSDRYRFLAWCDLDRIDAGQQGSYKSEHVQW